MATSDEKNSAFAKAIWDAAVEYISTVPDDLTEVAEKIGAPHGVPGLPSFEDLDPCARTGLINILQGDLGEDIHSVCGQIAQHNLQHVRAGN
jgi:hypothetical protein